MSGSRRSPHTQQGIFLRLLTITVKAWSVSKRISRKRSALPSMVARWFAVREIRIVARETRWPNALLAVPLVAMEALKAVASPPEEAQGALFLKYWSWTSLECEGSKLRWQGRAWHAPPLLPQRPEWRMEKCSHRKRLEHRCRKTSSDAEWMKRERSKSSRAVSFVFFLAGTTVQTR